MAGLNPPIERTAARRLGDTAFKAPRVLMSWEDWLTLLAALVAFVAVAVSIDQAEWVREMPSVVPTAMAGLVVGMVASRLRFNGLLIHPAAVVIGVFVVILMVQQYADGETFADRVGDMRTRLSDWWDVVRAGDISNDNLPFVTLVHGTVYLATYLAAYAIYRWHNPWLAILPGGIVLLANIGLQRGQPTGAFVVFLFGSILLIARLHLQKNQEKWKKQGIDYPDFISLSAGQLTLIIATGLLFLAWLIPVGNQSNALETVWSGVTKPFNNYTETFGRLFHNVDSRKGAELHTFGPFLAIDGDVRLGTKQLYEVKSGTGGLIRGASYDEYTGNGWKASERDRTRVEGGELAASPEVAEYQKRDVQILGVTVNDGANTILTSGIPLGTNVDITAETPKGYRGDIEQLSTRRGLNEGDTYNSLGSRSVATGDELRATGDDYPEWVTDKYLQLPEDLPNRVIGYARDVVTASGARNNYETALAIEEDLRALPFDFAVAAPPAGRDLVDFLLFDLKRGYFDYQASAMAVLLRSLGIPARVAVGYVLDPTEVQETNYTVRKNDAYAWVEVYFPTYGWVTFNPTGDQPSGGAEGAFGSGSADPSLLPLDDPSLEDLFADAFLDDGSLAPVAAALAEDPTVNSGPPWTLVWSLVGALVVVAAVAFAGRTAWNWGLGGLDGTTRMWARVQRLSGWAKLGSDAPETPREFSQRIGHEVRKPHESSRLADAYEETRYGPPDLERSDPATTQDSYKVVRNSLFASVFQRRVPGRKKHDDESS